LRKQLQPLQSRGLGTFKIALPEQVLGL
jgi:hypothetical protein